MIPHSKRSSKLKRYDAWRLVATSPAAILRLRGLAIVGHRVKIDPSPRDVDPPDLDAKRVPEAQALPAARADEDCLLLVQLPPLAAHPTQRQHPLELLAVPE